MKIPYAATGIFVIAALLLFSVGLFMIGDRHKAFSHHVDFYTELADVNGLAPGSKVRVDGYDAGQLVNMQIPDRPSAKFRLQLHIDDKLHTLVRTDSQVTVESDGVVGDKFLQIHSGTDNAQEAASNSTLPSKEPVELSAVMAKATGFIDQANGMIVEVKGKLNGTLDTATATISNANGLITEARRGKGAIGTLLNDQQTAAQLKQTFANAQQASDHLNQITVQAGQLVTDVQSRNLPAKIDDTVTNARGATQQLNQASQTVNATLSDALGPDRSGANAAENMRESLSNVNLATANIADDTEALKHGFLFRGYFKKRGFYSLQELTPEQYRSNAFFQSAGNRRFWLDSSTAFSKDATGAEVLTDAGRQQIDQVVGGLKDIIIDKPLVIEGYSTRTPPEEQVIESKSRTVLVAHYLEKRFHLRAQDIGVMELNATPPQASGKSSWDGACIVILAGHK